MKCPKCSYLGFETGDRCKNCGYDFSLMADAGPERIEIDLDLRDAGVDVLQSTDWLAQVDVAPPPDPAVQIRTSVVPSEPEPAAPAAAPVLSDDSKLPLFTPAVAAGEDEPLVKVPPIPRRPLSVRRTPETPRLRTVPHGGRPAVPEPALEFEPPSTTHHPDASRRRVSRVWADPKSRQRPVQQEAEISGPGARLVAAAIDHLMLCGIDLAVVYFTLRMAGLSMGEWTALPLAPLAAFLLLIKLSYFCAFTAVGGQTIGKMAARIRVVSTDDRPIDAALAMKRALAGTLSVALLGLGFLPALLGSERRALHDRVARTRVIALRSA